MKIKACFNKSMSCLIFQKDIFVRSLKNARYAEKIFASILLEHGMRLHENASRSFKNVLKWSD